jgi:hypothetical protein
MDKGPEHSVFLKNMMFMIIIMGHECIWGTVWEASAGGGGGKERILRCEEDGSTLRIYTYEDS